MREDEHRRLKQRNTELEGLVEELRAKLQEKSLQDKSLQEFSSLPKSIAPSRFGIQPCVEPVVHPSQPSPDVSALQTQISKLECTIEQLQTALQYRQQTQTTLGQYQNRWQSILDALQEGVLLLNPEGVIETCNTRAEEILACPAEAIVSQHILDLGWQAIDVDQAPFNLEAFPGLVTAKTGIPCSEVILGIQQPNHPTLWLSINSQPLFETHQALPDAVVVSFVDITVQQQLASERQQLLVREQGAQTEAKLAREHSLQMLQQISEGVITFDRASRFTDINPEAAKILGRSAEALLGKILWQELPAFTKTCFGRLYRRVLTEGKPIELIDYHEPQNTWYSMRACPSPAGISLFFRPIPNAIPSSPESPIPTVDQSREVQEQRLRLLESVVVHANDAVMITEATAIDAPDPSILYVNEAFTHMLGYSLAEVVGQTPQILQGPKTSEKVLQEIRAARQQGQPTIAELIQYHKDGSEIWTELNLFPVRDQRERPVYWVGLQRNIAQRKKTETELQKALEKERELSDLKSSFVTTVSHEFRTPLSTILSSADMLEFYSGNCSLEKQLEHIERIQTAALTMRAMLNDILVLEQAEAGRVQFEPAQLNLRSFCEDLLAELRLNDQNTHRLIFESQCPHQDVLGTMDGRLLRQIFTNLLSNALKYSPKGSEIHFRLQVTEELAQFEIQDRGIGIPGCDQARLFEAFHRGKNVGMIAGNGLGLAIVKQSVDMHQGQIEVTSQEHQGTTVRVSLPLQPKHDRPIFPGF